MTDHDFLQLESAFRANYNAYAEGLDSKNWAMVRACFADEIEVDYGAVIDPSDSPGAPRKADDWVAQLQFNIGGFDITRHTITNHRTQVEGDSVSCRAYLVADHVIFPDASTPIPIAAAENITTVVGEYTNHYTQIDGEWKISKSKLDMHWSTGNIDLFQKAIEKSMG